MFGTEAEPILPSDAGKEPGLEFMRNNMIWICLFLVLLTGIVAYSNTLDVPFQFDDVEQLEKNPVITSLDNFVLSDKGYNFMPRRFVGYLTFALNYYFGGFDVTGYHVVNLSIHIINSMLIYFLVILTFRTPYFDDRRTAEKSEQAEVRSKKSKTGNKTVRDSFVSIHYPHFVALFSALLFVSHPLQTQAVTYIVQRLTSLATLFYLLSIVMYIKGREMQVEVKVKIEKDSNSTLRPHLSPLTCLILSFIAAVCAMKTKEIAFTLPIMILLYEFTFFRSSLKTKLLFLIPMLLTLMIIPLSMMQTDKPLGELLSDLSEKSRLQTNISRWDYLLTEMRVIVTYIRLLLFPVNQNLDYDYPIYQSFFKPQVFLSFLLLSVLFGTALYLMYKSRLNATARSTKSTVSDELTEAQVRRSENYSPSTLRLSRLISFGILWFFLALSVESSFIPIADVIFEHRVYLPSVGIFIAISSAFLMLTKNFRTKWRKTDQVVIAVFGTVIVILAGATIARNATWQSRIAIWEDVVNKSPGKARGYNDLGNAYNRAGLLAKAEEAYNRAITLDPDNFDAHNDRAIMYAKDNQIEKAIEEFKKAIALNATYAKPHTNLGVIYAQSNQLEKAIEEFNRSIELNPNNSDVFKNRGITYARMGDTVKAIQDFTRACFMGNRESCGHLKKMEGGK